MDSTPTNYRWVIVALGALFTCVAVGAMFSVAVYLQPMSEATGWSRAGISGAMTLAFLFMGAAGFAWGAATLASSFGMAFGPLAGGWVFDTFHDYRWLYIGSCAIGLGAVAIALTFPPLPSSRSGEKLRAVSEASP